MVLGGKVPDFVNINGKKQVIELFGDYWHGEKRTKKNKETAEREKIEHYAQFGFGCLVVWECELKDLETLEKKLLAFGGAN